MRKVSGVHFLEPIRLAPVDNRSPVESSCRATSRPSRDVQEDPEYLLDYRLEGYRSLLGVPLLRDGKVEGVFTLSRPVVGEFTARQVDLARTFADQAMIAIENARLFNETTGGAGAADSHGRHPQGHRKFARRRAAGVRGHRRAVEPASSMACRRRCTALSTTRCT